MLFFKPFKIDPIAQSIAASAAKLKADDAARRKARTAKAKNNTCQFARYSKDQLIDLIKTTLASQEQRRSQEESQLQTASLNHTSLLHALTSTQLQLTSTQQALRISEAENLSLRSSDVNQRLKQSQQQITQRNNINQIVARCEARGDQVQAACNLSLKAAEIASGASLNIQNREGLRREKLLETQLKKSKATLLLRNKQLKAVRSKLNTPAAKYGRVMTQLLVGATIAGVRRCKLNGWCKGKPGPKPLSPATALAAAAAEAFFVETQVGETPVAQFVLPVFRLLNGCLNLSHCQDQFSPDFFS